MQSQNEGLEGLDYGNAWALRSPLQPSSNWFVGDHPAIPPNSLRFLRHGEPGNRAGDMLCDLAVKWFEHQPSDEPSWGEDKPLSTGRTLSLLAGPGAFELCFRRGERRCRLVLDQPGDFALWGEGLEHSWRVLQASTVLTVRWSPAMERTGGGVVRPGEPWDA
jgi:hypothetical protein